MVEVTHEGRLATTFDMLKDEEQGWKILPPVREWVVVMIHRLIGLANSALNLEQSQAVRHT